MHHDHYGEGIVMLCCSHADTDHLTRSKRGLYRVRAYPDIGFGIEDEKGEDARSL